MFINARLLALAITLGMTAGLVAQSLPPVHVLSQRAHQNGKPFPAHQLFHKTNPLDASAARFAQYAQFLELNPSQLALLFSEQPRKVSLALPYQENELVLDLELCNVLASDFAVFSGEQGDQPASFKTGLHYRGALRGATNSFAAISIFEDEVLGIISDAQFNNLVLGRVELRENKWGYMLYSDLDLAMDNPFECTLHEIKADAGTPENTNTSGAVKPLRIGLEADNALIQQKGSVAKAVHYLAAVFHQVATVYARDGVDMILAQVSVPTTPLYDHTAGANAVLEQFRVREHAGAKVDISQLIGLARINTESVAYLGGVCSAEYAAALSAVEPEFSKVPTFSWVVSVVAHQTGHQLGSPHTQWCGWSGGAIDGCAGALQDCTAAAHAGGNTLMSYCPVNNVPTALYAGLGRLPGRLVRERVGKASCLQLIKPVAPAIASRSTVRNPEFGLAPNPAGQQTSVLINYAAKTITRIVVLDLLGRPVQTIQVNLQKGSVPLDLGNLSKGIYLVQVFDNQNKLVDTRRLIRE